MTLYEGGGMADVHDGPGLGAMSTTWDDVPAGSTQRADGLLDDRSVVEILAAFLAVSSLRAPVSLAPGGPGADSAGQGG